MPISITMPALSPTMTEGNLVKWHKKEGDTVKAGDVLAEIETDKATMEVEAVDEGTLGRIMVAAGTQSVAVNAVIGILLEEGEEASAMDTMPAAAPAVKVETVAVVMEKSNGASIAVTPGVPGERIIATPLAKRIATQNSVNLTAVQGSGPRGRIVKYDVEQHMQKGPVPACAVRPSAPAEGFFTGFEPPFTEVPLNQMRKIIARRLCDSKQTVPHFYLTIECNLDRLLKLRHDLNSGLVDQKVSVNDFIIKACAYALHKEPQANAAWADNAIRLFQSADVAVAVAIEGGLITPIVRDASRKGLLQISSEMKLLAARAREGKLAPSQFQGGTFSVSNLGMFGIKEFSAIINPPQACILAVGMGEERAIVSGGIVSVATMMSCTLSVDHRVVDGAVGSSYLKAFKEAIENPVLMLAA